MPNTVLLTISDSVSKWYELNKETSHSRFPVVDNNMKVHGIVTSKDVMGQESGTLIDKVMTKGPMTVGSKTVWHLRLI